MSFHSLDSIPYPAPSAPLPAPKKQLPLKAPPNLFKRAPASTTSIDILKVPPIPPPRPPRAASPRESSQSVLEASIAEEKPQTVEVVLTPKQRHRQEVIREVLATEKDYVRDLNILTSVFLLPLRAIGVLGEVDITKLFSDVEVFSNVNAQMLTQLQDRVASAPPTGACVGDVFKLMSNFLKMYNNYCSNYPSAIAFLSVLEKNPAFKHFLDICQSDDRCKGLTLNAYLIKPVQRICKYPLLLKELVADTEPDHPDYEALVEAQKKVSEVANFINEETRKSERSQKLLEIQSTVDACIPLVAPARRFLREGSFKAGNEQKVQAFLFNDLVLIAIEKNFVFMRGSGLEYKISFPLQTSRLVVVADTDLISNAFAIQEEEGKQKNSVILCSATSAERDSWVKEIKTLIKDIQKKKLQDLKSSTGSGGTVAMRSPRDVKPSIVGMNLGSPTNEESITSRPRHQRRHSATGLDSITPRPLFLKKK